MKWNKLKIREFADVITGGTPSTSKPEYWKGGKIPWLNSGELNQSIIVRSNNSITDLGLKSSNAKLMPADTVLIALTGTTTGKAALLTFEASANQSVTGILPSKKHYPKYLYYYLSSRRNKILNDSYGGAQKHISQSYVEEFEVPLPPYEVQKEIADILDKVDDLRLKDQQLIDEYDKLLQSIFYQMFGNLTLNNKGWDIYKLGDITDKIQTGPFGSLLHVEDYVHNGIPLINPMHIVAGKIKADYNYTVSNNKATQLNSYRLRENDIIMARRGEMGRCAVVYKEHEGFLCGTGSLIIRLRKNHSSIFYKKLLSTKAYKEKLEHRAQGVTMHNLNQKILFDLEVCVPPIDIQIKFENIYRNIRDQKVLVKNQLQESELLFQSLLQKAFKGELIK